MARSDHFACAGEDGTVLASLSPRRRAVVAGFGVLLLGVVAFLVVALRPSSAPAGVPVFVVPGYGGDAASVSSLADALRSAGRDVRRSEEHTSELQSRQYLVCRLLLEKKKKPSCMS